MEQIIPGSTSPRTFALNHARPKASFHGCSRISEYELMRKLGEGTFGEVHLAQSRKSGAFVALKKIIMHHEKDGFPITALREIKLLKLLSHQNVLKLDDMAVEHPHRTEKRKRPIMYMVTPYMDHDLSGLLDNPSVTFTEPQIKCYLMQLLEGLKYLHENQILHRDMKAANLLINNKGILQIADFGLARHYHEPPPSPGGGGGNGKRDYTGLVVTRWYRPPELLLSLKKYTTAIDLWGVGCVFGEMLVGKPILSGDSDSHQLDLIWDLVGSPNEETMPGWKQLPGADSIAPRPRPGCLSNKFREYGSGAVSLLKELLKLDWKTRINAMDALDHPYFKMDPLPARPQDIPSFEESHELDRRKFHDRKAVLPPAPKGGTVGMGPETAAATAGFNSNDVSRNGTNGSRHTNNGQGMTSQRNHNDDRRGAPRQREHGLPPRPPLPEKPPPPREDYDMHRDRDRALPRSRGRGMGVEKDTYIPTYDGGAGAAPVVLGPGGVAGNRHRDDRGRDHRPRDDRSFRDERSHRHREPRDDRWHERERQTRSRSRSPGRADRGRDRDRDVYRR